MYFLPVVNDDVGDRVAKEVIYFFRYIYLPPANEVAGR